MFRIAILFALLLAFPGLAWAQSEDFENGPGSGWSRGGTLDLDGNTVFGPFNSRNDDYRSRAKWKLDGLESAPHTLQFDLILFGRWDSQGSMADRFELRAGGETLLTVDRFPCKTTDADENLPEGTPGAVRIGNRYMGHCVLPQTALIPATAIEDGELKLEFWARVSGRRSEFWALDNLRLAPAVRK